MIEKPKYDFPRYATNTLSFGDSTKSVIIWVAGLSREEFEEWKEFVLLTVRIAERTILPRQDRIVDGFKPIPSPLDELASAEMADGLYTRGAWRKSNAE